MAVAARQEAREYYAPATRVYSHNAAYAEPAIDPQIHDRPVKAPGSASQAAIKARQKIKHRLLVRFVSVCAVLVMLSALLFVMVRYEKIADEYAAVNTLRGNIKQTRLDLEALNVSLQYAVDLDQARAAAERLGMDYPVAGQFVRVNGSEGGTSPDGPD